MERITMYNRTSGKGDTLRIRLRLIDGWKSRARVTPCAAGA